MITQSPVRPFFSALVGEIPRGAGLLFFLMLGWGASAPAQGTRFESDANGSLVHQFAQAVAAPQIVGQPQTQIVVPGSITSFSVVAADTRGLTYQWQFNGTNLPGAAAADAVLLTNVSSANEGPYQVVLANSAGSVTSAPAMLYMDSDGDGLPDSWELAHFGNLNQTTTGDFDGDGVSNLREYLDGTDPASAASVRYRLTILQDGGVLTLNPAQTSYTNGQSVTITATAQPGEIFRAWTGEVLTQSNTITLVMNTNKTLFAHFNSMDFIWVSPVDGDWAVAANWQPNLVPGTNDNVTIANPVKVTVSSDTGCRGFVFGAPGIAPTLAGTATLTIHGAATWNEGYMMGSGRTVVDTTAAMTIANAQLMILSGRTLENGGAITWIGTATISGDTGAVITNRPTGLFTVVNSAAFGGSPGTPPRFDNAGTFRKSGNAGGTSLGSGYQFYFNNYGTVDIQSGTLYLNGGYNAGAMHMGAGTTLSLANYGSSSASSITGAGVFSSDGFNTLDGLFSLSGNWIINASVNFIGAVYCTNNVLNLPFATASFNGTGTVMPAQVNLTGGGLAGAMPVTIGGAMTWTAGTMSGAGTTYIPPGVILGITNSGYIALDQRTLDNAGTVYWNGAGNFSGSLGSVITNRPGALFSVQNSATFAGSPGTSSRMDNAGMFRKSVNPGGVTFGGSYAFYFNNYGTVDIQSGGLYLNSGGYNAGAIHVPAGTAVALANYGSSPASSVTGGGDFIVGGNGNTLDGLINLAGTWTIYSPVSFVGTVFCTNNTLNIPSGTATFSGSGSIQPATLNLTGGNLDGPMPVTVGSAMSWTAGSMTGAGLTLLAPGATALVANSSYVELNHRRFENAGVVVWTGGGTFAIDQGGVLTNRPGALFNLQGPGMFGDGPGSGGRIDNAGIFRKSLNTGTTLFGYTYDVPFVNYGTVDIQSGVLYANGGYYTASPAAVLKCTIWGTTAGATYGQLAVPGTVSLDGTLSVTLTNHYSPATNDAFAVVSSGGSSGAFAKFIYPSNAVTLALNSSATAQIVTVTGTTPSAPTPLAAAAGLISWYQAESNALDAIGTNHGALTNGTTFAAGKVGQSFLFDGTDDYVAIPDSASLHPASVTLEAWVKLNSTNGIESVIGKTIGNATLDSYALAVQNGVPLGVISDANNFGTFLYGTYPLTIGQWYHLAYTFDANSGQQVLYVNGASVAGGSAGRSIAYDAHAVLIGADVENAVPNLFMNGEIDEATIYSRALDANEIGSIFNVGAAGKQLVSSSSPQLKIETIGAGNARLSWPASASAYHLQSSTNLATPGWQSVALTPVLTGTSYMVTNALPPAGQQFYRLSNP